MKPVSLRADVDGMFRVFHGSQVYWEVLTLDQLRQAMSEAQRELARLTDYIAAGNSSSDHRQRMTWLFTPDYRRPDNLQGIFRWLYLTRVTCCIIAAGKASTVELGKGIPYWVTRYLTTQGIAARQPGAWRQRLKAALLLLQDGRDIVRFIVHSLRARAASTPGFEHGPESNRPVVLVKRPTNGLEVRYGPMAERIERAGYRTVFQNFDQEDHVRQGADHWKIFPWMKFRDLINACLDARHCRSRLRQTRKTCPHELAGIEPAFSPSFYGLARRALQYRLWRRSLEQLGPPHAAISVSSLNKPFDRLHIQALNTSSVPVCIVLPRPLSRLRPAEELVKADIENGDTLPAHFIVRDRTAPETLRACGIAPSRIGTAVPRPAQSTSPPASAATDCSKVLILLSAREGENLQLIELVAEAVNGQLLSVPLEVCIKGHPSFGLKASERELAQRSFSASWHDVSTKDIEVLVHGRTLAVTSSSSALIEATLFGAAAIWAAWFSELAPQLEFMAQVCQVAESREEFTTRFGSLVAERSELERLAAECQSAARTQFGIDTTISEAAITWLHGLESAHQAQV